MAQQRINGVDDDVDVGVHSLGDVEVDKDKRQRWAIGVSFRPYVDWADGEYQEEGVRAGCLEKVYRSWLKIPSWLSHLAFSSWVGQRRVYLGQWLRRRIVVGRAVLTWGQRDR